ncbi:MAG: hypothetical protein WBE38_02190 [Terracidiphilus sp.]
MEHVTNDAGYAHEELVSLKQRQERLLVLIGELLQTNEELRLKVARLEAQGESGRGGVD